MIIKSFAVFMFEWNILERLIHTSVSEKRNALHQAVKELMEFIIFNTYTLREIIQETLKPQCWYFKYSEIHQTLSGIFIAWARKLNQYELK